jgi:hypothetical protein
MSGLSYYINGYYATRRSCSLAEQLADGPYAATSVLMGLGLYGIQLMPFTSSAILLLIAVPLGGLLYIALSYVFRLSAFVEMTVILAKPLPSS